MTNDDDTFNDVIFTTKNGKAIRINFFDIPKVSLLKKNGKQKSRKSVGVRVIKLENGDQVVAVSKNYAMS